MYALFIQFRLLPKWKPQIQYAVVLHMHNEYLNIIPPMGIIARSTFETAISTPA